MDNRLIVIDAMWDAFSRVNGNPDLHASGIRFALALFFLWLLFVTIRMRALTQYRPHRVVALVGCVIMMIRESAMAGIVCGWELKLYDSQLLLYVWPPVEHFFSMLAFSCIAWYTVEASDCVWLQLWARRLKWPIIASTVVFYVYALTLWKSFFAVYTPTIAFVYNDSNMDWQAHAVVSVCAFLGIIAACKRQAGPSYLLWFWVLTFVEQAIRAHAFSYTEGAWLATVLQAMHIWAIPLLLLHFINAYVIKLGSCAVCKRDVRIDI